MKPRDKRTVYPESALAHRWLDGLEGLEIGPSSHNPFGLKTRNIGLTDEIYEKEQLRLTGTFSRLDIVARADEIPVADESEDFVLSSHVIEHCPNFIKTMLEWYRIVKKYGYIFMIVPHRDASPSDVGRPLTDWNHIVSDCMSNATERSEPEAGRFGHCHYHVFDIDSMKEFIDNVFCGRLVLAASQDIDDKIGNGFTLVYRKSRSLAESFPWFAPVPFSTGPDSGIPMAGGPEIEIAGKGVVPPHGAFSRSKHHREGNVSSPASRTVIECKRAEGPLFSVIVPAYNHARYLPDALDSLLAQTYPGWEAVVVDDGSTDNTREVLGRYTSKHPRIRAIHKENGGVASALNEGIRNSRGEWICWLSSDDMFEPGKLEVHCRAFREHPDVRFFLTGFHHFDEKTGAKTTPSYRPPKAEYRVIHFLHGNYVHGISIAIHRSVFEDVGLFKEELRYGQDYDIWLRISARHRSQFVDAPTCVTRIHEGQGTASFPEAGRFDSARSSAEFLNNHKYGDLFPLIDLTCMRGALKAIRKTFSIAMNPEAHMYSCGYNPSLLRRFREWYSGDCPFFLRIVLASTLNYLAWKALIWKALKRKLPEEIKDEIKSVARIRNHRYRFEPYDFLSETGSHARRLALAGRESESLALSRYLAMIAPSGGYPQRERENVAGPLPEKESVVFFGDDRRIYANICMVTYNRLEFTKQAIESIVAQTDYPHVLTVVDNGSSDGTREYLMDCRKKGRIDNLVLIGRNAGVSKASNLGWHVERNAGYYVKFDNDIVIGKKGWLSGLVKVIDEIPELGAVAYNFEPTGYPLRVVSGSRVRVKDKGNLGGACILIPKRTEDFLGYWSEEYGLYGEEDADYGVRIRLAGRFNAYMEDEDIGVHLPAGKAAAIDMNTFKASDGIEETMHPEYREWKDSMRRKNVISEGRFRKNVRAYKAAKKSLRVDSAFVRKLRENGQDPSLWRGEVIDFDTLPGIPDVLK